MYGKKLLSSGLFRACSVEFEINPVTKETMELISHFNSVDLLV